MKLRKSKKNPSELSLPQISRKNSHPFNELKRYIPNSQSEYRLYNSLREAVPIIDAAIFKIIRLLGDFEICCSDPKIQKEINKYFEMIPVNVTSYGIKNFIAIYFDQLLTYGTAVGEILLDRKQTTVARLYNAPIEDVELLADSGSLELCVCSRRAGISVPVKNQNLILTSVLNPEAGSIEGRSILKGLPFVSEILMKIYNSIGSNWERVGNVRFAVTYKPQNDQSDRTFAKERAMHIAREWSNAMQSNSGQVSDFIAVGDVDVKVIGADNQILDSTVPVRQMLEQIIAKLGIPPFLLGLSWSTTERMSSQQVDILTSELESYRSLLSPIIMKIVNMWIKLNGYNAELFIEWNNINLQDEVELARASLLNAQAENLR